MVEEIPAKSKSKIGHSQESEKTPLLKTTVPVVNRIQTWPQHVAAVSAGLMTLSMGFVTGWSAFGGPYLLGRLGPTEYPPVTTAQASWVVSVITLGALSGALPGGKMAQCMGRKWFLIFLVLPLCIGWLFIINYRGYVSLLIIGRFFCGYTLGGVSVTVPLYYNEIADPSLRGKIGSYFDLMLSCGIFLVYVVGALTPYRVLTMISSMVPVVFVSIFAWMPESPYHLVNKGKTREAEEAIRWLRRGVTDEELTAQMIHIKHVLQQVIKTTPSFKSMETVRHSLHQIKKWNVTKRALIMAFGLMTFQRLSGATAITYYTVEIFQDAKISMRPENATILVGLLGVIGCICSAFLVDRVGRRVLLIASGFMLAISFASMSGYYMAAESGINTGYYLDWIPLTAVLTIILFFTIGLGPIPFFMIAELLPSDVKDWGMSLTLAYMWVLTFLVAKTFPFAVIYLGNAITYGILGVICSLGVIFFEHYLTETKNKTAIEIYDEIGNYVNIKSSSKISSKKKHKSQKSLKITTL